MTTYTRPSYEQLQARIAADLAAMPAVLREPLSAAWARACHGEHGHLDWLYAQCTPLACEEDRLQDWATLYGVTRLSATAASGSVTFTGTAGATLLKDAVLRGANGQDYTVSTAVTLAGASGTAAVVGQAPGVDGNLPAGAELTLVDPLPGIGGTVTVATTGLTGGAVQEQVEDWRARVVDEWQTVVTVGARGGRAADYVYWAKSGHPSVTGALVQAHTMGMGTVVVRPICNGLANRLPTQAVLDAVLAKLLASAPVMPEIYVEAPALRPVAVTLDLAATVDTAGNRAAIAAAVASAVLAEQSAGATLLLSELDAAVATVTTQYVRTAPVADLVCAAGEVFAPPVVTWA
jgi:uncharacterized phage protein gp47/JayE